MRSLGIDYGEKRIGLAVSDPLGMFAQPLQAIEVGGDFAAAAARIVEIAEEYEAEELVIGLPKNLDDTIGFKAEEALAFKRLLEEKTSQPVIPWDERLSTVQAERHLRQTGWSRRKRARKVDMVAAGIILQGYLDFLAKAGRTKDPS